MDNAAPSLKCQGLKLIKGFMGLNAMLTLTSCPCKSEALKARVGKPSIISIIACHSLLPFIPSATTLRRKSSIEGKVEMEVQEASVVEVEDRNLHHPIPP